MAKTSSKSKTSQYANYKSSKRWEANRRRKLEKTLKSQPNNEQVKRALKNIHYRRRIPTTKMWSKTWINTAKIFKLFEGRFDPAIMSSNAEVAKTALQKNRKQRQYTSTNSDVKNPFSIAARTSLGGSV